MRKLNKCSCCSDRSNENLDKHSCCSCEKTSEKSGESGCCKCCNSKERDQKFNALVGPAGAGHYVKMIHNGIEYALLQAYSEGFHLLKSGYYEKLNLEQISKIWNNEVS